jgi:hypothetical protein
MARETGRETDRDAIEHDLMRLVLTVVELLRQLMERQALRRVDRGDLTPDQEERIGLTLMLLAERMDELCERYGVAPHELNLDLGPLGPLLPPRPHTAADAERPAVRPEKRQPPRKVPSRER